LTSPEFVKEVLDVRMPTFSRQTETADSAEAERPAPSGSATTPVRAPRESDATTETNLPPAPPRTSSSDAPPSTVTPPPANPPTVTRRTETSSTQSSSAEVPRTETQRAAKVDDTADLRPPARDEVDEPVVPAGPKPRSSMLATLGLIFAVGSALLVLSGPLLGYGIGVAVVALILSLSGIHATGKRHVAGKTDALIGMVLSLAAIVVGVLALTGSLSWLGTDMQPVSTFRQWLDAHFVNRF
jgi:hypothetical protein